MILTKEQIERRRKQVWQELQTAHRLPAADREALKAEYDQLLTLSVWGAK